MAHCDGLGKQRLLDAGRGDVNFQKADAGIGDVRRQIHGIAPGLQIDGRRGDLLTLRGDPHATRKRTRTIEPKRQREPLAGKNLLRRGHAFELHRQTRRSAGRHRKDFHSALAGAQSLSKRMALGLIPIAHQYYAARATLGKSAQSELQAPFDVGRHTAVEIDALRNRHLVRLRGDRPLEGVFGKGDQTQLRVRFFAYELAKDGLTAFERFPRHARGRVHYHGDGQPLHQQLSPRIRQRNRQRRKGKAFQREAHAGSPGRPAKQQPRQRQQQEQQKKNGPVKRHSAA